MHHCPTYVTALTRTTDLVAAQGHYDDAKPLYERSLAIDEKALGPDHPHVATDRSNLAGLLESGESRFHTCVEGSTIAGSRDFF